MAISDRQFTHTTSRLTIKQIRTHFFMNIANWPKVTILPKRRKSTKTRTYTIRKSITNAGQGEELSNRQQKRQKRTRLEAIVGNPNRLQKNAEDLVYHFEQRMLY
jgi:hypothetical protein